MIERILYVMITVSSDFRIHAHGGYFVDVRHTYEHGRQLTTRNPATMAEALAFVDELRERCQRETAASETGRIFRVELSDRVPAGYRENEKRHR